MVQDEKLMVVQRVYIGKNMFVWLPTDTVSLDITICICCIHFGKEVVDITITDLGGHDSAWCSCTLP